MKRVNMLLLGSGLALLALTACTKELPYDEQLKAKVYSKAEIDTTSTYLYSSSMLNASRSSQDALPFSAGDNKRVKLQWNETSLRVIELEKDARFLDNETNNKLVLEVPVEHVGFQCTKDAYGECTNKEEERSDITWDQKDNFRLQVEAAKSGSLDLLPILISKTLNENCYEEVSAKVVDVKIEQDALNMQVERTFKTNIDCLGNIDSLSDATVTGVYHYSLVKTSAVASQDFKPVSYPTEDQGTFGFFATERTVLDSDNNASESGKQVLMNHWNPNRTEIVYHLSDEFAKPENAMIKDLTHRTVQALNDGLQKSGAKFQINLKDPSGKNPGDIRNSMIVLVEDPVAASVIGYGPQTEDPATGEIISARTVMFLGTIKKFIGYTYDDIVRENKRALQEAKMEVKSLETEKSLKLHPMLAKKMEVLKTRNVSVPKVSAKKSRLLSLPRPAVGLKEVNKIEKEVRNYKKANNLEYTGSPKARFKYLQEAKNCAFGLNTELFSGSISPRLAARFPADSKPWNELSDTEKQHVMNVILPEIWVPTLIHELGHNLGLRHNFQGSEDMENFYTDVELQSMGIDHKVPFTSVMEYGDDLKALPVLGKYDIAALRFAYAKKVELADGSIIDVVGSLADMKKENAKDLEEASKAGSDGKGGKEEIKPLVFKPFGFCTDEHTGINAGCRRFDLGTTYTEIVQNEIQAYKERYESRNFRNGRAHMSLMDDPAYAAGVANRFIGMRIMQETYESIKHRFNLPDNSPWWDSDEVPFLRDIKQASLIAGQFLQEVMETPDLTCVIARTENPNQITDVVPLGLLDASQLSCQDWEAPEGFVVIGEYGKLFKSKKSPTSDNSYADQIDVRGYWIDKLMASRILFARQLGSSILDRQLDNFADKAELKETLQASVHNILLNRLAGPQEVRLVNGETVVVELPVDTAESHVIDQPLYGGIARALAIPNETSSFSHVLAKDTAAAMVSGNREVEGLSFADSLKVLKTDIRSGAVVPEGSESLELGNTRLIATEANSVAQVALKERQISAVLEKVDRDLLLEIYQAKVEGLAVESVLKEDMKAETVQVIKAAWEVQTESIEAFLVGLLNSSQFYNKLVFGLPN